MALNTNVISLIRFGILGALLLLSLITLGIAAHLASIYTRDGLVIPDTLGMAIAIPVLTMVAVIPVIVIDFIRKGAVTGMVAVELAWTSLLWILWLANAGLSADRFRFCAFFSGVDVFGNIIPDNGPCNEQRALLAFSWLSWLLVTGWFCFLLSLTITAFTRGNSGVWTAPVQGTDFFANVKTANAPGYNNQGYNQGYPNQGYPNQAYPAAPMQQQYTGPAMQTQYTGQTQQATYPPAQGYDNTVGQV